MINNEPCSRSFSLYNSTPSYQGDWKIRTPRSAGCLELWKLVLVCFAAEAFDQILFLYVVFGKQWVATLYLSAGKNSAPALADVHFGHMKSSM